MIDCIVLRGGGRSKRTYTYARGGGGGGFRAYRADGHMVHVLSLSWRHEHVRLVAHQ